MKKMLIIALAAVILMSAVTAAVSADAGVTYILGDADGDGNLSILDATRIQRVLAGLMDDSDGMIALRGDINGSGLDILDATYVQRYLVDYNDGFPINEERTYIAPTEPVTESTEPVTEPTQPATSGSTADPDELPFIPA